MKNNKPIHSLAIIGNGFDLNCKIPSSFKDFIKTTKCTDNIWYLLFDFAFSENYFEGKFVIVPISNDEVLWMDVESLIKRILFSKTDKQDDSKYLLREFGEPNYINFLTTIFQNRFNYDYYYSSGQIISLREFFKNRFPNRVNRISLDIVDFLYEELLIFEKDFQKYIEIISKNRDYQTNSEHLFSLLLGTSGMCDVLSFNYTFPKIPEKSACYFNSYNHIHGNINCNEIIIGYDSSDLPDFFDKKMRLSKIYQKMFSKLEGFKLPNVEEIDRIIIYGHSLGEQDYSYFHSIFDYFNISENNRIVLEFCYTPYKDSDEENQKVREEYVSKVIELLNKYSRTFNNANDRIDTLANRLLLENRLKIRPISKIM